MHARVDGVTPAAERLQASAEMLRLLHDTYAESLAGEYGAAFQPAEAAADNDYVELLLHAIPVG